MTQILGVVLSLFAVIGLGKAAVRFGYLDASGTAVLSKFAFMLPVPALLFGVMAEGPPKDILGTGGVYFLGCLALYGFALCAGRWLRQPSLAHRAVFAMDATLGNLVFLGTPLIFSLYGSEGLSVLVGTIVLSTLLIPISSVLIEMDTVSGRVRRATVKRIVIDLVQSPAVYPVILGLSWHLLGWPLPTPIHLFVDLFAKAAAPIALFCVGASLPSVSFGMLREAAAAAVAKLILAPAVVGASCLWVGFEGIALAVPIVAAAMPTAANAFLLAKGVTEHADGSATTVVVTTGLSLLTLPLVLHWVRSFG